MEENKVTLIYETEANYDRNAWIQFKGNDIIFDCSDGEYGPIKFSLELLKSKLIEHEG